MSVKLKAPSTAPLNSDTRLDLPLDPISLFSSFPTLLASFPTLWPFSFAPFSTLVFPLHSPHVFLQTTVHHLEGSLDAGGPPHLPSSTLFGHNVRYFSLLLPHTCFLVNAGNKTTLFWWKSPFCNSKELRHPDFWSHLFSWAIFSLSEMSTVLTTASAFFLACSIFFNIWKSSNSFCCNICQDSFLALLPSPPNGLTLRFFLALASATRLMGRALISFHFSLYSSTISRVTGTGFLLCFCSSCRNHSGTSHGCSELANLQKDPTVVLQLTHHRYWRLILLF